MIRALFLFLAAGLIACGGAAVTAGDTTTPVAVQTAPAAPPYDPLQHLPEDTFALMTVDVSRITGSPYYPMLIEFLRGSGRVPETVMNGGLELVAETEALVIPIVPHPERPGDSEPGVIFVRGSYGYEELAAKLREMVPPREQLGDMTVAGHRAFGNEDGAIVELEERWWALGPMDAVAGVASSPPHAHPALESPSWRAVEARLAQGDAAVRQVMLGNPSSAQMIGEGLRIPPELTRGMESAGYSLDFVDGVSVESTLRARDEAAAQGIAEFLRAQSSELFGSIPARAMGLSELSQYLEVRQVGASAEVSVAVPDPVVRDLVSRLGAVLQMAQGMQGSAAPVAP